MTDLTQLSPSDLDRLAAEALGLRYVPSSKQGGGNFEVTYADEWRNPDGSIFVIPASKWHPTSSHDQCQLLVDEVVRRGLVWEYGQALYELWKATPMDGTKVTHWSLLHWLATAPALDKCRAAVICLTHAKGENDGRSTLHDA